MKWVNRDEWRDAFDEVMGRHLGPACSEPGVTPDDLASRIGADGMAVLWGCIFEDMLATETDDGRNVVDDYVKRRGWKETVANRNYMLALRVSVMSLYEISDIVPEQSFLARDLIRGGDPIRVREKSATRSLKSWDRIAARIVDVSSTIQMAGGVLPLDYDTSEDLLRSVQEARQKARAEAEEKLLESGMSLGEAQAALIAETFSETEILRASASLFTNAWLGNRLGQSSESELPELCNSDGEPLVFITAQYQLTPTTTADAVREALAAIRTLRPASDTFWNWIGPQRRSTKKNRHDGAHMLFTTLDDGSLVLGTIELMEETLALTVNSEARLRRGRTLLEQALDGRLRGLVIERQTAKQLMAAAPKKQAVLSSGLSAEEERTILHKTLTEHYRRTLDEPVPVLDNSSPREAIKTEEGRRKVIAWLKLLENSTAHHQPGEPMSAYNFAWLWQELGIADQRR